MVELKQLETKRFSRIYSYGAARGELAVTNDEIAGPIDSSDEWIRQRTGIITRARATEEVQTVDLAEEAAKAAIAKAQIDPKQLGAVIVATVTNSMATPSLAALLADRVGANPAAAYDISAACAGFAYAVAQGDALIKSGLADYVLVLGAEKLSDFIDPTDRTISFLLGDGAGAAVLGPSDYPGVGPTIWGSDGSKWDAVGMKNTWFDYKNGTGDWPTLRQDGRAVFTWAVWEMAKVAEEALAAAGITAEELGAFIPHQANMRIVDKLAKELKLSDSVLIADDIETTGNTSAASIPLAASKLLSEHPELSGKPALQIGFGAGLVFAAQVVILP